MYRYGEYCPLAKTTSILGDSWTPLIVREMLQGREHFNELVRSLPDISRSLLTSRLRSMERSGIVERSLGASRNATRYVLTEAGRGLRDVLNVMSEWGDRWTEVEANEADIHPMTSVCMLRARCQGEMLPPHRVVVQVVTVPPKGSVSWLVQEDGVASLCESHPGFDVDLVITSEVEPLYSIWREKLTVAAAVQAGSVRIEGDRRLALAFPAWFNPHVASAVTLKAS